MGDIQAVNRPQRSRIRRRWPAVSVVFTVLACGLLLWRIASSHRPQALPPAGVAVRVIRVIDGDTLLLEGDVRVRLIGVNIPETKHPDRPVEPLGEAASRWLESMVQQGPVTLEYDRERFDQYRRVLAYIYLADGTLLNERLIQLGYSPAVVSFPIRSDRARLFKQAEKTAQASRSGIWSKSLSRQRDQKPLSASAPL